MVTYFCDRCGNEIDSDSPDKRIRVGYMDYHPTGYSFNFDFPWDKTQPASCPAHIGGCLCEDCFKKVLDFMNIDYDQETIFVPHNG